MPHRYRTGLKKLEPNNLIFIIFRLSADSTPEYHEDFLPNRPQCTVGRAHKNAARKSNGT